MQTIKYILISMRPKQWLKNLFVFAAIIFVRDFTDVSKLFLVLEAFVLFCLVSSATYIINDFVDRKADQEHPYKRLRPLASGALNPAPALVVALILLVGALAEGFLLGCNFGLVLIVFATIHLLYTFYLKRIVIVDVVTIAIGFVLRVVAGAVAINVIFSAWLVFCTFFLTLFLAISKRKSELSAVSGSASRSVLSDYSVKFLDQMNMIVLPLTITTYTFYTFSSEHSRLLMLTVPIVLYGLFRYLYIADRIGANNDGPTDYLLRDHGLQATAVVWLAVVGYVLWFYK